MPYLWQKWSRSSVVSPEFLQGEDFLTWIQAIISHVMRSRNVSASASDPPWGPLLITARIYSSWEADLRADVVSAATILLGRCLSQVHSRDIFLPTSAKMVSCLSSTSHPQHNRNWGTSSCNLHLQPSVSTFSFLWGPVARLLGL